MSAALDSLYQEVILDHFKNPRHRGSLAAATASATLFNPLCGDQIHLSADIEEGMVKAIRFEGHGCSISQASASMLAALVEGRQLSELAALQEGFRQMMRGERDAEALEPLLGDVIALEGVRKFSARVKCAALAWEALDKILKEAAANPPPTR